jgi:hypothetical protein
MIVHALASALLASSVVLGSAAAQDANSGTAPNSETAPPAAVDPTAARIRNLHDRLRITAEQEQLWDQVGETIRNNTQNLAPLLRERRRAALSGSAPEVLHAYEALIEAQLDSQRKMVTVFEPLYATLSEDQKKVADAIIRQGAQSALSLPLVLSVPAYPSAAYPPAVYTSPAYPPPSQPGVPTMAGNPFGGHHFHGLARPHVFFGRHHR